MNELSPAPAFDAEEKARPGNLRMQFVGAIVGRILLVGSGLFIGAVLGAIVGIMLGVIPISC